MKKIPKILSMVMVVALIAAIPASTQIVTSIRDATSDENSLPLLILVNRLELSEEQMGALDDILTGLIGEREAIEGATAEFEQTMIEFDGTGEELDAMLVTFREEQAAAGEALRESIETSLDEVRDLLSINQGLILQEEFSQLMGGGLVGVDQGTPGRTSGTVPREAGRSPPASTARGNRMAQQSARGEAGMDDCTGDCEAAGRANVQTWGNAGIATGRRFGQDIDDETMAERMLERRELLGNQFSERMIERFGERAETAMSDKASARMDRGDLRQTGGSSLLRQRAQSVRGEGGNLFEWLEKIADVLELKLSATE